MHVKKLKFFLRIFLSKNFLWLVFIRLPCFKCCISEPPFKVGSYALSRCLIAYEPCLDGVWWYGSSNAAMRSKYNLWFLHMTGAYSNRHILYSGYKGWCYQCSSGRSCGWLYFDCPGVPNGQRCSNSSGQWRYAATLFPSTLVVTCVVMLLLLGQAWAGR